MWQQPRRKCSCVSCRHAASPLRPAGRIFVSRSAQSTWLDMKPQEALQEQLAGAIQSAFEVFVQLAAAEVTKLIGRLHERMRRENESLQQRLQAAEAQLDSVTGRGRSAGVRGHGPPAEVRGHSPTEVRGHGPPADLHGRDAQTDEVRGEVSHVCLVRLESINQSCLRVDGTFASEAVVVKRERRDEEGGGLICCVDSIKEEEEDFSPACVSVAQVEVQEEWKPEQPDVQSQDTNSPPSCSGPARAHSPNFTSNLPPPTDQHASLSSEITEAPPQVHGVHVRSSRNLVHTFTSLYSCRSCGQTFPLPSLLRRHYAQCQQRLQQHIQQPIAGSRRTRLQIYPPGCSPFRCTECNREFNRMENLKTHLRIHTGERPYTCSVCSKCFRHSGALTRHFRIHTGEKPYVCGQCGKSFRNCGGLKFHQRSHSK